MKKTASILIPIAFLIGFIFYNNEYNSGIEITNSLSLKYNAIFAHRGFSAKFPENTLPSFKAAANLNADYLETDLQLTKDGNIILFHDDILTRTTNISKVFPNKKDLTIKELTLNEIQQLDAGSWFNQSYPEKSFESFKDVQIPTLENFLDFVNTTKCGIIIETKLPEKDFRMETKLIKILKERKFINHKGTSISNDVIFQSFSVDSLKYIREQLPEAKLCLLISKRTSGEKGFEYLLTKASELKAFIGISGYLALPWNIRKAHNLNLPVSVYTIDSPQQIKIFKFFGADMIFTNRPDTAKEILW